MFLDNNNLNQFYGNFIEQVYDDLNQIIVIEICKNVEEIESFLKDVGLVTKAGYKRRFIAATKIEISKADQGLECSKESMQKPSAQEEFDTVDTFK